MSPHRISRALSAVACSILLASGLFAQGEAPPDRPGDGQPSPTEFEAQKQNLRERNRAAMYPGVALEIVGLEEGDNDLRSRTPALLKSDRNSTILDPTDAYRRKLAMYADGGHELQRVEIPRPTVEERVVAPKEPAPAKTGMSKTTHKILSVCLGVLVSALFCVWGFKRYLNMFERSEA